ncbi:hypothetical protein EJB05_27026, partial [Eragrostis curvula]
MGEITFRCGNLIEGGAFLYLHRDCLTRLSVRQTRNFFLVDSPSSLRRGLSSPFSVLQSLKTDDAAGLLAPLICRLLSSSLTHLKLEDDLVIECFSEQQEEALQLLTSLEHLTLWNWSKLQCLPAGLRRLPKLKRLEIILCSAIRSLPKGSLPNSLQELEISNCHGIRTLPEDGLPNSLQQLRIGACSAIRSLPKDVLPDSLQELQILFCPAIRTLPKDGLPSSLRLLDVKHCGNEELKRHCRKLIGTIPIVEAGF